MFETVSPRHSCIIVQSVSQIRTQYLTWKMHISSFSLFLKFFKIYFSSSPFSNDLSLWVMHDMHNRGNAFFKSRDSKSCESPAGLLEGESIALRTCIKTHISFIERIGNSSMETRKCESHSSYPSPNNRKVWKCFISFWKSLRRYKTRTKTIGTMIHMSSEWLWFFCSCLSCFKSLETLFIAKLSSFRNTRSFSKRVTDWTWGIKRSHSEAIGEF